MFNFDLQLEERWNFHAKAYDLKRIFIFMINSLEKLKITPEMVSYKFNYKPKGKTFVHTIKLKKKFKKWKVKGIMVPFICLLSEFKGKEELDQIIRDAFPYGADIFLAEMGATVSIGDLVIDKDNVEKIKSIIDNIREKENA